MKVAYRKRFLKDLASVPANFRGPIERFVFEELPRADSLQAGIDSRRIATARGKPAATRGRLRQVVAS